jgi:hypothetical protein
LVVERRVGDRWEAFPLPAPTRRRGRFSTFVELGPSGSYQLRVRDPQGGVTSHVVVLRIG